MNSFIYTISRELGRIIRRPRYLVLLTIGVIFSYVFFITLTREGQPLNLPVGVVDHDGSYLSRRLSHELNATQGVEVIATYASHAEARQAMQRQEIYAFMEIPAHTYSSMLNFEAPHVAIYTNNAYLLGGSLCYKSLATMGKLASGAIHREILYKKGIPVKQAMALIQPIQFDTHLISNPMASYQPYLMATILPGIVALLAMLLTIFEITIEQKEGTAEEWVRGAHGNVAHALWGKMLPYTLWFVFLGTVGNLILFGPLQFACVGNYWFMVLNMILLVVAAQSMGVFIISVLPDMHMATCIGGIYGALSFTMAGFSFPVESMITPLQGFSMLFPLRQYYLIYSKVAMYGGGIAECWYNICIMFAHILLGLLGTTHLSKQKKNEKLEVRNIN